MADNSEKIVPHEANFKEFKKWKDWKDSIIYGLLILSFAAPITNQLKLPDHELIVKICDTLVGVLTVLFFIFEVVSDRFYISAEYTRRNVFIDNSLGSLLTGKESKGYFSNDDIAPSLYKATINTFENCFFTYNISQIMLKSSSIKNLLFFAIFLVLAFWGADRSSIIMPLLQGILSGHFLKGYIDSYFFTVRTKEIFEIFKTFFSNNRDKGYDINDIPMYLKLLIDYETNLAHRKYLGSSKIYNQLNTQLSGEWNELKKYYKIQA